MDDPNDMTVDEEQFIRDHLNFLNESDDEFSEGSENSSIQFTSYEENNSIYGISPISSKVSETWSSTSSGSITSPKETTGPTSSNVYCNPNLPRSNFSKEDWYSPFFMEDIAFGQDSTSSSLKEIDMILYQVWRDTFASKSAEYFLREKIFRREGLFSAINPIDARMQQHHAFSKLASEMWPYSELTAPKTIPHPCTYQNPCAGGSSKLYTNWSRLGDVPLPVFSVSNTHSPVYGAEEALNTYFEKQKSLQEPDLSRDFSLPLRRTSTPINSSSKDSKTPQFAFEQPGDVAGALTTEEYMRQFAMPSTSTRKRSETRLAPPETTSFEDMMKVEGKGAKASKNNRSSKQCEFCKFCYKNGELSDIYMSHVTKSANGTIVCPILRKYVCDLCGATGDNAHTRKYCSLNTQQNKRHPVFRRLTNGVLTSCHNHK